MNRFVCICGGVVIFGIATSVGWRWGRAASVQADVVSPQLLAAARQCWESGRYTQVISLLRDVPDDHPFAAEARLQEGRALWKLGRWQMAESLWSRALVLDPRVPQAGWHLLRFYYVEHRWREAEELAMRLYDVEPDPRDQTLLLLELLRMEHERLTPAETVLMLEPVIALEPENYHALRVVGLSYVQLKRAIEGLGLVERAIRLDPENTENWLTLATCLDLTGELGRLVEFWPQMPLAVQRHGVILRMRGISADLDGEIAQAERFLSEALEADPVDYKAHYELARVLRRRGMEELANEHERTAVRLDSTRDRMGLCYAQATQLHDDPTVELCRELSQLCRTLNRNHQAELWDEQARRRDLTSCSATFDCLFAASSRSGATQFRADLSTGRRSDAVELP